MATILTGAQQLPLIRPREKQQNGSRLRSAMQPTLKRLAKQHDKKIESLCVFSLEVELAGAAVFQPFKHEVADDRNLLVSMGQREKTRLVLRRRKIDALSKHESI